MKILHLLLGFTLATAGCESRDMTSNTPAEEQHPVQLFNEAVLRAAPTDALSVLLPAEAGAWSPKQVILDYKDGACYGAMVHYDKSGSFEQLRDGINRRFRRFESDSFADDPEMGMWRNEEAEFAIQLVKEDDTYMAIYLCFVDYDTMAEKLHELHETEPELFQAGDDVAPDP